MERIKQKGKGLDAGTLKIIAIIGMLLDHIAMVFEADLSLGVRTLFYACGGLTFPIMAYLLVEGYKHTSNVKRYGQRLLLFAIISLIPFMWAFRALALNVLFTLLLGLISLYLYDNMANRRIFWLVFIGLTLCSSVMDWELIGVPMILMYYLLKGKWTRIVVPVLPSILIVTLKLVLASHAFMNALKFLLPQLAFAYIGGLLSVLLLKSYNGQRGKSMKYLFYAFYPGHLLLLALIRMIFHL